METYKLSKHIVKLAAENKELENLRLWSILRSYSHSHKGIFHLDELAEHLFKIGQKSLEKIPKNISDINKWKKNKHREFKNSIFFEHIKNDSFRFKGQKSILLTYRKNVNTEIYVIPGLTMSTRQAFLDTCIGIILNKRTYSNKTAAKIFSCSPRRIQQGTARNDKSGLFPKQHRKIIESFGTFKEAKEKQIELADHGIYSSNPFSYRGSTAITVNTSNKYFSNVLRRYKGKRNKAHTQATGEKVVSWFKPAFKGKGIKEAREYQENRLNAKILEFNTKVYNLNAFISDHSIHFAI
jgi:hypothetical protein